jgi:hypothetical protein
MLLINLFFNDSVEIKNAIGTLTHKLKLNSSENTLVSETNGAPFQEEKVEVKDVYFYYSLADKLTKTGGKVLAGAGSSVLLVATVINLPLAVYLMKLFQYTSFLSLINIEWPKNVKSFIEVF